MPGCVSASPCARRSNAWKLHDDNIELSVSLLDQRYLAGDAVVYGALLAKLPDSCTASATLWCGISRA